MSIYIYMYLLVVIIYINNDHASIQYFNHIIALTTCHVDLIKSIKRRPISYNDYKLMVRTCTCTCTISPICMTYACIYRLY